MSAKLSHNTQLLLSAREGDDTPSSNLRNRRSFITLPIVGGAGSSLLDDAYFVFVYESSMRTFFGIDNIIHLNLNSALLNITLINVYIYMYSGIYFVTVVGFVLGLGVRQSLDELNS